ncbi:MAG TPA: prolipoprotein diacylglyceryl transferase family protein, partial [Actinoplanes sp.]|nr:prolipoprotein diacylglyceryl transferase family protein [Actinoplanes sp.]
LPLSQAVGRLGNWFNNELYGGVTTLPWGLRVHQMDPANPGRAEVVDGHPVVKPDLYHPTFLYELVWNVGVAALVVLLDRKFKFGRGRAFAVYVMGYTVGRFWIELMRTDEANEFFGVRLNVFTSILVFLGALAYFLIAKGPREYVVPVDVPTAEPDAAASEAPADGERPEPSDGERPEPAEQERPEPAVTPRGYRVVTADEWLAYRQTGVAPAPVEAAARPADEH